MSEPPKLPLSALRPGCPVRAVVTGHQPWGIMVDLVDHTPVGASLDVIRRGSEPGVRRLVRNLPPVGASVDLVVGEVRVREEEPQVWIDLTAP